MSFEEAVKPDEREKVVPERRSERSKSEILGEIDGILTRLLDSGGLFEVEVVNRKRQKEWARVDMRDSIFNVSAVDSTGFNHHIESVPSLLRALTPGQGEFNIRFTPGQGDDTAKLTLSRLQELDIELLHASGINDGIDLFEASNSLATEPGGTFEPELFLSGIHQRFGSQKEKLEVFVSSTLEQIEIISGVIAKIESIDTIASEEETISEVLTESIARKLSKEQRFNIKRQIYNIASIHRKINKYRHESSDPKPFVARLLKFGESNLVGDVDVTFKNVAVEVGVHERSTYENLLRQILRMGKHEKVGTGILIYIDSIPVILVDQSYEDSHKDRRHESRHVRNDFMLAREEVEELKMSKDEILAYLGESESLRNIEALLTRPESDGGLYQYVLGKEWDTHCEEIRKILSRFEEGQQVNLDVLAIMPLKYWGILMSNMERFVDEGNESVVTITI